MSNQFANQVATTEFMPLLLPTQVATYLQVSEKTLANWRYLRRGPSFIKVGRDIRYRQTDVERWLGDMTSSAET